LNENGCNDSAGLKFTEQTRKQTERENVSAEQIRNRAPLFPKKKRGVETEQRDCCKWRTATNEASAQPNRAEDRATGDNPKPRSARSDAPKIFV